MKMNTVQGQKKAWDMVKLLDTVGPHIVSARILLTKLRTTEKKWLSSF